MKRYLTFLLLISVVFLFGCEELTVTPTTTTTSTTLAYDSYFPLIAGRVITYEVVTDETTIETWQYIGNVPLSDTLEVFKINVISGGNVTPYYYREDHTGAYAHGSGSQPTTDPEMILKYPLEVGTTWTDIHLSRYYDVVTVESITTPAGTFSCKKVRISTLLLEYWHYCWYAKDVGMIKEEYGLLYGDSTSREVISKNF
jgi:hypothetical protein